MMRGELGVPEGGFPKDVQEVILKGEAPRTKRAGEDLPPVDFDAELAAFREKFGEEYSLTDFISYKFYPKVFEEGATFWKEFGDVSVVPTPLFFYGMTPGQDVTIEIARGKTLLIRLLSISEPDEKGHRTVFFKLNGQTRNIDVLDRSIKVETRENRKAEAGNAKHISSPLQGRLSKVLVKAGDAVKKNQPLFVIEAMKMESTVSAASDGEVGRVELADGTLVSTGDLVLEMA
jgi:pyruvate carboxylase